AAELSDVRWIDTRTIAATVPAALPAGVYGLSLEGPYGSGSVDGVFQVADAAPASLAAAAAEPPRVRVDDDVAIAVTVSNSCGMSALAVAAAPAAVTGPPATLQAPPERGDIQGGGPYPVTCH